MAAAVAATSAWERLAHIADKVATCSTQPACCAAGQYYKQFPQTTNEEVLAFLRRQHAD
jgi:predicted phosphoribosyltransferase